MYVGITQAKDSKGKGLVKGKITTATLLYYDGSGSQPQAVALDPERVPYQMNNLIAWEEFCRGQFGKVEISRLTTLLQTQPVEFVINRGNTNLRGKEGREIFFEWTYGPGGPKMEVVIITVAYATLTYRKYKSGDLIRQTRTQQQKDAAMVSKVAAKAQDPNSMTDEEHAIWERSPEGIKYNLERKGLTLVDKFYSPIHDAMVGNRSDGFMAPSLHWDQSGLEEAREAYQAQLRAAHHQEPVGGENN